MSRGKSLRARTFQSASALLSVILAAGCGSAGDDNGRENDGRDAGADAGTPSCISSSAQAIFNGSSEEQELGLSDAQSWAIGGLEDRDGKLFCTGAVVRPGWLLTAAHCAFTGLFLRIAAREPVRVPLGSPHVHPSADLALFELAAPEQLALAGVRPIALHELGSGAALQVGAQVVLAGVGLTETGSIGELRFVEEDIATLESTSIVVDGKGETGACKGDSGGPLLRRGTDSGFEMIGVLTGGEQSCLGRDLYVRLDAYTEWLEQTMGTPAPDCPE